MMVVEGFIAVPTDGREPYFKTFSPSLRETQLITEHDYFYDQVDFHKATFELGESME